MRNKNAKVSDPNSFVTCAGDRYRINYSSVIYPDGTLDLVPSGKDDIQAFIDSFREQTDFSFILNRLMVGDTSVLRQDVPLYGDFTEMPKTYAEALQLVIDSEAKFMKLPLDVRNSFDNDFKKWFAQSGTEDWLAKMDSVLIKETSEISEPEVVKDEP